MKTYHRCWSTCIVASLPSIGSNSAFGSMLIICRSTSSSASSSSLKVDPPPVCTEAFLMSLYSFLALNFLFFHCVLNCDMVRCRNLSLCVINTRFHTAFLDRSTPGPTPLFSIADISFFITSTKCAFSSAVQFSAFFFCFCLSCTFMLLLKILIHVVYVLCTLFIG